MNLLKDKKFVALVGIGGIGMSGLARLLQAQGIQLHGIDAVKTDLTDKLQGEGILIEIGEGSLPANVELLIYSEAVPPTHPVRLAAQEKNIPQISYFEALGEFTRNYKVIAIAGSHGKSTTTAMLGLVLKEAGLSPTVLVGTQVQEFGNSNVLKGEGEFFVVEACEYRRNFMSLHPHLLAVLNMEWDHTDFFKSFEEYKKAFTDLAAQSEFVLWPEKIQKYEGEMGIPGEHNRMNAGMVLKIAEELKVPEKIAQKGLASFKGTWRRFEHKGQLNGAVLIDDYAHHPTEIKATLSAAKEAYPQRRIVALFEPHQYSRTHDLLEAFAQAFSEADEVIIPSIYKVRDSEEAVNSISPQDLAGEIAKHNPNAHYLPGLEASADYLKESLTEGDLLLVMGAGPVDAIFQLLRPIPFLSK